MNAESSLAVLLLLGAVHGLNPAMGWLFAVSLGLQEERRRAVWRAFAPLAVGHGLAIAVAGLAALLLGVVMPVGVLRWVVGGALVAMGVLQLARHGHPRWGGMRVGVRDLAIWSFLMASAHGAGLMALPFLMPVNGSSLARAAEPAAAHAHGPEAGDGFALLGTAVHTAGYLLAAVLLAVIVYEMVGLRVLRKGWLNIDLLWALALILTGVLTPLL